MAFMTHFDKHELSNSYAGLWDHSQDRENLELFWLQEG